MCNNSSFLRLNFEFVIILSIFIYEMSSFTSPSDVGGGGHCKNFNKKHLLEHFVEGVRDFWVPFEGRIKYLNNPSVSTFLREAVLDYQPVIIRGLIDDWPALTRWSGDYLRETIPKDENFAVNVTATGFADSVIVTEEFPKGVFVYPLEHETNMDAFLDSMESVEDEDVVPYLSVQNDNFRGSPSFQRLHKDVSLSIPLAEEAFDLEAPEAVNLWIGDQRSVSSIHKDHFENMYAVIKGCKTFTLLPPTDCLYLPEADFPTRKYNLKKMPEQKQSRKQSSSGSSSSSSSSRSSNFNKLKVSDIELSKEDCPSDTISWIPCDPDDLNAYRNFNRLKHCSPIRCKVMPGEVLYIPSMWYHRVSQDTFTIAVNFWYDQRFNFRFAMYNFVKNTKQLIEDDDGDEDEDVP